MSLTGGTYRPARASQRVPAVAAERAAPAQAPAPAAQAPAPVPVPANEPPPPGETGRELSASEAASAAMAGLELALRRAAPAFHHRCRLRRSSITRVGRGYELDLRFDSDTLSRLVLRFSERRLRALLTEAMRAMDVAADGGAPPSSGEVHVAKKVSCRR